MDIESEGTADAEAVAEAFGIVNALIEGLAQADGSASVDGAGAALVDFSDLFKMNVPVGASFASKSFNDFSASIGFGASFKKLMSMSASCTWYEAKLDDDDLPCLSKNLVKNIRKMSNDDEPDLDRFIDRFGTHAYKRASFGGMAV